MEHGYTIEVSGGFVKEKHVLVMFEVISCSEQGNNLCHPTRDACPEAVKSSPRVLPKLALLDDLHPDVQPLLLM